MKRRRVGSLILVFATLGAMVFVVQLFTPQEALAYRRVCDSYSCWTVACDKHSDCGTNGYTGGPFCQGNEIYQNYINYTCNSPGGAYSSCTNTTTAQRQQTCPSNQPCSNGKCVDQKSNQYCAYHASKKCVGSDVYWFDSCGKQQEVYHTCATGSCSNGACAAYTGSGDIKGCIYNKVYSYDSYGNQQGVYQDCSITGATCQDGKCVGGGTTSYTPPPAYKPPPAQIPAKTYIKHYSTDCFNNDVYWLDSGRNTQDIYKSCNDNNQCTQDTCQEGQCKNTLQCDSATCKNSLPDYTQYCQTEAEREALAQQKEQEEQQKNQSLPKKSPVINIFSQWYVWVIILAVLAILFIIIFRGFSSKV